MKDLKEIILERRVREWEIKGKKVPQLYIHCLNDYLEEIAEELAEYDKQVRKEVVQEIRERAELFGVSKTGIIFKEYRINASVLEQIENGGENEKID